MKKFVAFLLVASFFAAALWFVWFKPAPPPEEEAKVVAEVPVHVGKITRATLRDYVTAYGLVEPEPAGKLPAANARVASPVAGVVTAAFCAEGQHVEKDALLFQLDSRSSDVAVSFAEKTVERQKKLLAGNGTSQKALQEAEMQLASARVQQALLQIKAPLSGSLTRINVKAGEAVDLTTVMAELIDLDRLVVNAAVPSAELRSLKADQPAQVHADKTAEWLTGLVTYVGSQIDPKTDTAAVRVALAAQSGLRPGQFVAVRIVCEEHKDCLAVPVESVVKTPEGTNTIALVQDNQSVIKPVETGLQDNGWVEVKGEGLEADAVVVTEGAYGLPNATKVRVLKEP